MPDAIQIISLVVATLGTVAAIAALSKANWPKRDAHRHATIDQFRSTRDYQREHIRELILVALDQQIDAQADRSLPVLTRPGWILPHPVPLKSAVLRRIEAPAAQAISGSLARLRPYWPLRSNGQRIGTYHEAIELHDKPSSWFNGASYRLLEVTPSDGTLHLSLTDSWYWEMIDTTESLLYEAAHVHSRTAGKRIDGRYRRHLSDPFALALRSAIPGVDALTIRVDSDGRGTFFVHRRDAKRVASAANLIAVVPAGEFQPSDDSWSARINDFDLWRSIAREYVEEFLGVEEARVRLGSPIDFLQDPPYLLLHQAYQSGHIRPYLLGICMDPVTWKPTILTTCLFEAALFDELFADMVSDNHEGVFEVPARRRESGGPLQGWPFSTEAIRAYGEDLGVLPVARAGILLAWRFRQYLGLNTTWPR